VKNPSRSALRVAGRHQRQAREVDRLPRSHNSFGFEGDGDKEHAVKIIKLMADLDERLRAVSARGWQQIALALIERPDLDLEPVTSRTAISEPIRLLYRELGNKVDEYFISIKTTGSRR
jgi:hypothetical protein